MAFHFGSLSMVCLLIRFVLIKFFMDAQGLLDYIGRHSPKAGLQHFGDVPTHPAGQTADRKVDDQQCQHNPDGSRGLQTKQTTAPI
jgi:hypothetical protein